MALFLCPQLRLSVIDFGVAASGGKVYTYLAGTTTEVDTYSDKIGTINENPITLDANGSCSIWLDEAVAYKLIVKNSSGLDIYPQDNITVSGSSESSDGRIKITASDTVGYTQDKIESSDGTLSIDVAGTEENQTLDIKIDHITAGMVSDVLEAGQDISITEVDGKLVVAFVGEANLTDHHELENTHIKGDHTVEDLSTDGLTLGASGESLAMIRTDAINMADDNVKITTQSYNENSEFSAIIETVNLEYGSAYTQITKWGGIAIKLTAAESISEGDVVCISTFGGSRRVAKCPRYTARIYGVALGYAAIGDDVWITIKGRCVVRLASGTSPTYSGYTGSRYGYPLVISESDGRARCANVAGYAANASTYDSTRNYHIAGRVGWSLETQSSDGVLVEAVI